jgi:hypothetical protein
VQCPWCLVVCGERYPVAFPAMWAMIHACAYLLGLGILIQAHAQKRSCVLGLLWLGADGHGVGAGPLHPGSLWLMRALLRAGMLVIALLLLAWLVQLLVRVSMLVSCRPDVVVASVLGLVAGLLFLASGLAARLLGLFDEFIQRLRQLDR